MRVGRYNLLGQDRSLLNGSNGVFNGIWNGESLYYFVNDGILTTSISRDIVIFGQKLIDCLDHNIHKGSRPPLKGSWHCEMVQVLSDSR